MVQIKQRQKKNAEEEEYSSSKTVIPCICSSTYEYYTLAQEKIHVDSWIHVLLIVLRLELHEFSFSVILDGDHVDAIVAMKGIKCRRRKREKRKRERERERERERDIGAMHDCPQELFINDIIFGIIKFCNRAAATPQLLSVSFHRLPNYRDPSFSVDSWRMFDLCAVQYSMCMLCLSTHASVFIHKRRRVYRKSACTYGKKILDGARIGHTPTINRKRRISVK